MADTVVILQPERGQLGLRRAEVRVHDAANPDTLSDLRQHRGVLDVDDPRGIDLRDVQRELEDRGIRLADVNEAGGDEGVHESCQLELPDPMGVQLAPFVADDHDLQSVPLLEAGISASISG